VVWRGGKKRLKTTLLESKMTTSPEKGETRKLNCEREGREENGQRIHFGKNGFGKKIAITKKKGAGENRLEK